MNWVGPIAWNILDQMRWRFASFFVRVNSVNCWFGNGFWNNLQKTEGLVLWGIPKHGYCCDRLNWFKIHSIFSAVGSKTPSGSNSIWPPKARCSLLIWTPTYPPCGLTWPLTTSYQIPSPSGFYREGHHPIYWEGKKQGEGLKLVFLFKVPNPVVCWIVKISSFLCHLSGLHNMIPKWTLDSF